MPDHRYRPPKAEVRDATPVNGLAPKPIALTVLQVLGYIAISLLAIAALGSVLGVLGFGRTNPNTLAVALFNCTALTTLILMQIHLRRRTRFARLLAMIGIALFTAPMWPVLLDPMLVENSRTKSAPIVYGLLLLAFVPFAMWAYAVTFSRKARRYFEGGVKSAVDVK